MGSALHGLVSEDRTYFGSLPHVNSHMPNLLEQVLLVFISHSFAEKALWHFAT